MMYAVKYFDVGLVEVEQTLFQSASEAQCWAFVRNHLTCAVVSVQKKARSYVVMDSVGCYCGTPTDIMNLKQSFRKAA